MTTTKPELPVDIQTILNVLTMEGHETFKGLRLKMRKRNLDGADLWGAHLEGADLRGTRFRQADLKEARAQGADLRETDFSGARLEDAHLQGADLRDARLQGANLRGARLRGADLRGAQLQGADLAGAQLQGARLGCGFSRGADLREADLTGAGLEGACLYGAQFQLAKLGNASLRGANSHLVFRDLSFAQHMRERVGKESDLSGAAYESEPAPKCLPDAPAPASDLQYSGATTGAYTAEEAEEWIAEYEAAMAEAPEPRR